jgi:3-deoxy-manno-octulosonate cytidylyltransferase (CMP-KDO synthetase)
MKVIGIIPARYASTRFPGKPLVQIDGMSMIERVYKQAQKASSLSKVIVATDDERIVQAVKQFNGKVMMTSATHQSGTDRCAEVAGNLKEEFDIIINIQGDEPYINPEQINEVANCFNNSEVQIATLIKKIDSPEELNSSNIVKVVLNKNSEALYFSRQPIPYLRNVELKEWLNNHTYYKHIGIYGFRSNVLKELVKLPSSSLEKAESLEQLRWLENGYSINAHGTTYSSVSIDTPEDLKKIRI